MKLLIVALASSFCVVIFFSKLKDVEHSQKDLAKIPSVPAATPRKPTTVVISTIKKKMKSAMPYELPPLTISETFRKDVPKNGAFWNRKLHSLLRQFDSIDNQTHKDPRDKFHCQPESFELLQTNIQDIQSYPPLYGDFLRGMECRDPPLLINQPDKCASESGPDQIFLLFAIKSIQKHFEGAKQSERPGEEKACMKTDFRYELSFCWADHLRMIPISTNWFHLKLSSFRSPRLDFLTPFTTCISRSMCSSSGCLITVLACLSFLRVTMMFC